MNLIDYVEVNFKNDIYITGEDLTNLRIINDSETSIYTRLFFDENQPELNINGRSIQNYSDNNFENDFFPRNTVIFNNLIDSESEWDDTNNSYEYIIENENTTNHTFLAYLVITNVNPVDEIILDDSIGSAFTFDLGPLQINNLTIRRDLYEFLNTTKHEDLIYAEEDEIFVIPLRIHVYQESQLDSLEIQSKDFKYDKSQSKFLLRTNPKLTGNIKLVVDSKENIYFDTFDVDENTSSVKYKRKKLDENEFLPYDIKRHFSDLPKASMFKVKDHIFNSSTLNPQDQYNMFYSSGVEADVSNLYPETKRFLAPLFIGKDLPEYFVVFAVDNYNDATFDANNFEEHIENSRIVKTFSLKSQSKIGTYLRNYINHPSYKQYGLKVIYEDFEISKWKGIDYNVGVVTNRGEYLYNYAKDQNPNLFDFEKHVTEGFERTGLLHPNIFNLEFLFDDPVAPLNKTISYFGFYVDENIIKKLDIDYQNLGITTDNIYITNNVTVQSKNFRTRENDGTVIINDIENKIVAIKGVDNNFLKIKSVVPGTLNNTRFEIIEDRFNISNLYGYDRSIKQFKAKPVKQDTQPFSIIELENNTIEFNNPFEVKITLPNNTKYILYGVYEFFGDDFISYLSYDKPNNTYYGVFLLDEDQDTTLTGLSNLINNIDIFESEKLDENKILIKSKEFGPSLNETKIELFFNGFEEPQFESCLGGGGFIGSQFLISDDDITAIEGTEFFETNKGYSKIKQFGDCFALPYIYSDVESFQMLTLLNEGERVRIDNDNYVYASIPIDPQLNIFSIYPVVDFDFTLRQNEVENDIFKELEYLADEIIIDLSEARTLQLKHNIHYELNVDESVILGNEIYKLFDIDDYTIDFEFDIGTEVPVIRFDDDYELDFVKVTILGETRYISLSDLDEFDYQYYIVLSANELEELENLLPEGEDPDVFLRQFIRVQRMVEVIDYQGMLRSLIQSDYLGTIEQNTIRIFENNLEEDLTITIEPIDLEENIGTSIDPEFVNFIIPTDALFITNLTLIRNDYSEIIDGRNNLITDRSTAYGNITDSLILPSTNKWVYYNSTDIFNEEYRLDNTEIFGTFGGSPDVKSINPSMTNGTYQWFNLNNEVSFDKTDLLNTEFDYFSELFYNDGINNNYSYIYQDGDKFYTMFKGIKFNIDSDINLNNYKFAIIVRKQKSFEEFVNYEIVKNNTFKTVTIIINISFKDYLFDSYGILYNFFYNTKHKQSHIYYFEGETVRDFRYGSFVIPDKIIPFNENTFILEDEDSSNYYKRIRFASDDPRRYLLQFETNNLLRYSSFAYKIINLLTNEKSGSILTQMNPINSTERGVLDLVVRKDTPQSNFLKIYNFGRGFDEIDPLMGITKLPQTFLIQYDLALSDFRDSYGIILNGGRNFYNNNRDVTLNNLRTFSNNELTINYELPKEIVNIFRYDGVYEPKVRNIIKFNTQVNDIQMVGMNNHSINLSYKNTEFSKDNSYTISEFYFNKLTDDNLNQFTDYHDHFILKSCLDNEYFKKFVDNSDNFEYVINEKLCKNYLNSLSINTLKQITIYPRQDEISFETEEKNDERILNVSLNLKSIIRRFYRNRVNVFNQNIGIGKFIDLNIYNILSLNNIVAYEQNNTDESLNTIDQNINITNNTNNINYNIVNDIVTFKIRVNKRDYKKFRIELNIKHK